MVTVGYPDSNARGNKRLTIGNTSFGPVVVIHRTIEEGVTLRLIRITPSVGAMGPLWKSSAYVGVEVFLGRGLNHKDDVVFGLECRDDGAIAGLICHWFAIDCSNDGSFAEANLVCEGARTDVGDHDATLDADLG